MVSKLYGYADVGRFGLGHGLLAWGRCVVWCHARDVPVIAPQWLRFRIGPYLRQERDKRFYYRLFRTGSQIGGIKRLKILSTAQHVSAKEVLSGADFTFDKETVVVFKNDSADNERKNFHEIMGKSRIVCAALKNMTRPRFLPAPAVSPHIAIHVRGGDFQTPSDLSALKNGNHNQRLPIEWYVEMLTGLRQRLDAEWPALLYSDCSDEELRPLLSLPHVKRSCYFEAITDMLAMSEATVLISSGSGFSRWGSYLGQVPRLCFPGQRTIRTLGDNINGTDLELECETVDDISEGFIDIIKCRPESRNDAN